MKEKELGDISNLVKNSYLITKRATLASKAELKVEHDKIVQLQAFDTNYFHRNSF